MENNRINIIGITLLALAVFAGGYSVSKGISAPKSFQRTVTVRGLSEREFDADMAVWPITFIVSGNDLPTIRKDIQDKTEIIVKFLKEHDITPEEITVKEPAITDTSTNMYLDQNQQRDKYYAKAVMFIRSNNVQAVGKALVDSINLMDNGIALTNEYDSQIQYLFTALNEIKPEMIAEATQNARKAAEQFAHDSGSTVGKIQHASQGLFSIEDAAPGLPERKVIRVVTNIEYILTD